MHEEAEFLIQTGINNQIDVAYKDKDAYSFIRRKE